MPHPQKIYWDSIADDYQKLTSISTDDFHFGPLLPGDSILKILPELPAGSTCLELGCGAAQNSIFLAKQGADCSAIDISPQQIEWARKLADANSVKIELSAAPLEEESAWPDRKFDRVHSVYALPFIEEPQHFIEMAASRLAPGGTLLLVTKHPMFCSETIELEDEETGLFMPSYFDPPEDIRSTPSGEIIASRAYPVSTVAHWIHAAGLRDLRIWEPEPLPKTELHKAPYYSPAWIEMHDKLATAPVSIIYTATIP
jgi:cyclopropane fatty-acyl-phospholipid synthase-like methyltransferase